MPILFLGSLIMVDFIGTLDITLRIATIGMGITAIELIADRQAFGGEGPFSAAVVKAMGGIPECLLIGPATVAIIASVQLIASIILVIEGPLPIIGRLALAVILLTSLLLKWRRNLGGDGAEQLATIIIVAAVVAFLPTSSEDRAIIAVAFVTAQSALAYVTSGLAKLVSPVWRDGSALPAIFSTYYHGHAWAAQVLRNHNNINIVIGWGIMVLWVLLPILVLVGPYPLALATVLTGLIFHVASAIFMGLNTFAWVFPSTYPCFFAIRSYLHG